MFIAKKAAVCVVWSLAVCMGAVFAQDASRDLSGPSAIRHYKATGPRVMLISYDEEYQSAKTLPQLARELHDRYGCDCTFLMGEKGKGITELDKLATADVLVLFVWRYSLPKQQMAMIRRYLDAGKPLVALRTSCHAFDTRTEVPAGWEAWPRFGHDVLGSNYRGHHRHEILTKVTAPDHAAGHAILAGIPWAQWTSAATLYQVSPLDPSTTVLLIGRCEDGVEPIAWTRNYHGGRVFYTSLGCVEDFQTPQFGTLMVNAVHWAMNKPVPKGP